MTPLIVSYYLAILAVGGICTTISGGGLGIVTVILGSFFFDIRISIAFTALLTSTVQLAKIFHFRTSVRWDLVWWYVLGGIPGSFIGGLLLFRVPARIPEILLALICLFFIGQRFIKHGIALRATKKTLVTSGALNGFIGGIAGNASLFRMSALISLGLTKEIFVGTSAMIAFLMNLGKIAAYAPSIPWTDSVFLLWGLSVPVILASVWIGKRLLRYVSVTLFEDLQLLVILIGAIRLLFFA